VLDGNTAYQRLEQQPIDLILCDVMMPLIDGYTFAAKLQEHERFRHIPLLFVSAKDQRHDKLKGYQAGGVDYLTKPIDREELLFKINALLKLRRHDVVTAQDTIYQIEKEREEDDAHVKKGHGEKILVVDDEPINIEVLKTLLSQYNYNVVTASDGIEGLAKIEADPPDLVLLDLMMPKMSGIRVCRILREEKQIKELPVIMLTAKGGMHDKIYGLNIGANDYIVKPFNKDDLLTRIHVFLRILSLQKVLAEERNLLRTLIDNIPDFIPTTPLKALKDFPLH